MQQQQPIVNIQFTPQGFEFALAALRKMPHEQVDGLLRELWEQYQAELARLKKAAEPEVVS